MYSWAAYTLRQAMRSSFPWVALLVILGVAASGLFVQALALVEREAVFQSWCMSLWRVLSAIGVIVWIHADHRLHMTVDRWRWCSAFDSPYPIKIAGQWGAGLILNLSLLLIAMGLGMVWSEVKPMFWLEWTACRAVELVLIWAVAQWAYASLQSALAGGAVLLLYLVGRLAPTLREVIDAALYGQPNSALPLKAGAWVVKGFLHVAPPFYALDQWGSSVLWVVLYAIVLATYTVWRVMSWSIRDDVY